MTIEETEEALEQVFGIIGMMVIAFAFIVGYLTSWYVHEQKAEEAYHQKLAFCHDFNDWNVDGVAMQAAGKPGLWATELQLPPGVYSYNFIVDGEFLLPDPDAPNQMPDGYGGTNSILLVKGDSAI